MPQHTEKHCLQKPRHGRHPVSIDRRMNKEDVVHIYNGKLLSH